MLPDFLHKWDVWDYWEQEQIRSMQENLKQGDVLFDIGAETGYLSALYAKYIVGGENVIMFEPTSQSWDIIYGIWEVNGLAKPIAEYRGFASDKTTHQRQVKVTKHSGDRIFKSLNNPNDTRNIPKTRIDDFVKETGIIPKAIKIDVEGAELMVLKGAIRTLKNHRPLLWISTHKDLMERDYNNTLDELFTFMELCGYDRTFLAQDHECHDFYKPR
jgi:FkbM family methyltransferase